MTLQLPHSEFPYIWGKFVFLFYQCNLPQYFFNSAPQLEIESTRVTSDNGSTGEWSIYRAVGGALVCIRLPASIPLFQLNNNKNLFSLIAHLLLVGIADISWVYTVADLDPVQGAVKILVIIEAEFMNNK